MSDQIPPPSPLSPPACLPPPASPRHLSLTLASLVQLGQPLVGVADVVTQHWQKYGRNYYSRYDFENVPADSAAAMMEHMKASIPTNSGRRMGDFTIATADVFEYVDPVDGSLSKNQGVRFLMADGSRIIFRLSGTAGSGATVRVYLEKYEADKSKLLMRAADALKALVLIALELSDLKSQIGTDTPTVIT